MSNPVGALCEIAGKESDTESGFDFFIARYYSSAQGRFLSPDEFAGGPVDAFSSGDPLPPGALPYADIFEPQSLNKYAYTFDNPLRYIDPNGHGAISFALKVAKAVWKGEQIASTVASVKEKVGVALDSSSPLADRIEAVGSALSEVVLLVSMQDAADAGNLAGSVLSSIDEAGGVGAAAVGLVKGGVYTLRDQETGEVQRSGRTQDLDARKGQHARGKEAKDLDFKVEQRTNSPNARRGLEQMLHDKHKPPLDRIRPISPRNPNLKKYMNAARKFLEKLKK